MRLHTIVLAAMFFAMCCETTDAQATKPVIAELPDKVYLFSSFAGNGERGLRLFWSVDGLKWSVLNRDRGLMKPAAGRDKLLRDPCIIQGPDGTFHMVWTTSWKDRNIGYASSKDLINWSEQKTIDVMAHEPTARNCWAPELFYDKTKEQYLIFWATTIPGRFPKTAGASEDDLNHRMYYVTTKDFQTFSETKLFYDGGFSVIDATMIEFDGKFQLIIKDETKTPPKKHLRIATGETPEGPFEQLGPVFTQDWVEGPSALKVGDEWFVYFDKYRENKYGVVKSKDLKTWEDASAQLEMPRHARHGTAFTVKRDVLIPLLTLDEQ